MAAEERASDGSERQQFLPGMRMTRGWSDGSADVRMREGKSEWGSGGVQVAEGGAVAGLRRDASAESSACVQGA